MSVLVVDVVADVVTCCADTYNCLCEQISSTPSSLLSFTRSEEKNKKKNCCSGVWSISGTKILAALWSPLWSVVYFSRPFRKGTQFITQETRQGKKRFSFYFLAMDRTNGRDLYFWDLWRPFFSFLFSLWRDMATQEAVELSVCFIIVLHSSAAAELSIWKNKFLFLSFSTFCCSFSITFCSCRVQIKSFLLLLFFQFTFFVVAAVALLCRRTKWRRRVISSRRDIRHPVAIICFLPYSSSSSSSFFNGCIKKKKERTRKELWAHTEMYWKHTATKES